MIFTMHSKSWSYFWWKKYNLEAPVLLFLIVLYKLVSRRIIFHKCFTFQQYLKNNICHIFSFFNGLTQIKHWSLHFWKNHSFKFGYVFSYVDNKGRFKLKEDDTPTFLMDSLKPSIEVYIFGRATLSSLAMSFAMFTTKEDPNTKTKVLFFTYYPGLAKNKKIDLFSKKTIFIKVVLKIRGTGTFPV